MAGYAPGSRIPDVDHCLLPIVALVLVAPTSRSPWSCLAPAAQVGAPIAPHATCGHTGA